MHTSRRQFLRSTALASAALSFPAILRSASPNGHFQVACIGANGMGFSDLSKVGTHPKVRFTAFCDVDSSRFDKADAAYPGVPHFADFREMFAKLGDSIDGVVVSTPDHMHAYAAIEAMRKRKHVYCQKPLSHTVWEARQMRLHAERSGVTTQMGNQIHSNLEYRLGTRILREGAIGKIREVHSWASVTGNERNRLLAPPRESAPVPATLNWDLWVGVAKMRDYKSVYHPFVWRDWQDFGSGALGDFGCHILDPVFTALGLDAPLTVRSEHSGINEHIWPTLETVQYVFPGNAHTVGNLKVTWYDGGQRPERKVAQLKPEQELPRSGSLFVGEGGTLVLPHVGMPIVNRTGGGDFQMPQETGLSHWHVWVDAAMAGRKTSDGFHYSGPLTETVTLGNVAAHFSKQTLEWDAVAMKVTNIPEANAFLTKTYRKGWEIQSIA